MIKFEHPNGRFYYLLVQKDMLNECVLTVLRGGSGICVMRNIICDDNVAIEQAILRITKRRLLRGYILIH